VREPNITAPSPEFLHGLALHQQGKLDDAERIYQAILRQHPSHFDALHLLGVIALQSGRIEQAVQLIGKAIELNGSVAAAHNNHAIALRELRRLEEALAGYERAIALQPDYAEAHVNRGIALRDLGRLEASVVSYDRAIALQPDYAAAYNNRGISQRDLGRFEEALADYDRAIALRPDFAEAHNNRGNLLLQLGRPEDALSTYDRAIALKPDYAEAHNSRGNALRDLERPAEAVLSYDRAIALQPDHAQAHNGRGIPLRSLGRLEEALVSCDRAIALQPDYARAHVNRGNALLDLGRPEEALSSYDRAIVLRPDYAEAHGNRANALWHLGHSEEALASYTSAIALQPDNAGLYFNRGELLHAEGRTDDAVACHEAGIAADPLHGASRLAACMARIPILYHAEAEIAMRRRRYLAALADLKAAVEQPGVMRAVARDIGAVQPFYLPYQGENDVVPQAAYGRLASHVLTATQPAVPLAPRPTAGARIRLGIVSGFFRFHTVFKMFLEGWLAEIDRDRFEVIGFHTGRTSDETTTRAAALCDSFVRDLPSKAAWRKAIADAAPHVLLYPEVGMDPIVGWLAPQRLARVQCVTWGHPETTGMPTLDYFLSSDLMEPPDGEAHYTERLVRLPRLGLHYTPDEVPPPLDRVTLGLDPAVPVYWSAQSLFKYLPRYDSLFPRIASAVGECQFVFVGNVSPAVTAAFRERLGHAFATAGLDAERHCVILAPMPFERFIGAVGLADVILDTPAWTGGRSTLDCLAQNPAIVTLPGRFMRGRQGAAILRRIGCEATIARSLDEYVAIAARLGLDAAWRTQVREAVANGKHRAFRDQEYVRALETFLAEAMTRS